LHGKEIGTKQKIKNITAMMAITMAVIFVFFLIAFSDMITPSFHLPLWGGLVYEKGLLD